MVRECKFCKKIKDLDSGFKKYITRQGKISIRYKCTECIYDYDKQYRQSEHGKIIKKLVQLEYYKRNPNANYKTVKKWRAKNPKILCSQVARKRAKLLMAVPKWLTNNQKKEIREIYKNCPKGYHVDHIIPLNGKNVRGFHVPWNLQYLTAEENIRKSNKVL